MSCSISSSHCNILTFNVLKQNVTSDEFLTKIYSVSAAIMINRMTTAGHFRIYRHC